MRICRATHTGSEVGEPFPAHSLPVGIVHLSIALKQLSRRNAYCGDGSWGVLSPRCICTLFLGLFGVFALDGHFEVLSHTFMFLITLTYS